MTDKRPCVVVRSVEVDFDTDIWSVKLEGHLPRVGAGLYVAVPVADEIDAAQAIARYYSAQETSSARPEHVAAHDCACAECVAAEVRCTCKDFPGADEFCTAHSTPNR
jgi:hypothetical protein